MMFSSAGSPEPFRVSGLRCIYRDHRSRRLDDTSTFFSAAVGPTSNWLHGGHLER